MNHPIKSRHPIASDLARRMKRGKIVSLDEAVGVIRDGDTLAFGGFVGIGFAEGVARAIEKQFIAQGKPKDLTIIYSAGIGDGKDKGLNHLAHEGLVSRVIGGHWGLVPKLQKLAIENKIDGIIKKTPYPYAGYHKLRSRFSGNKKYIDFHLLICRKANIDESHQVASRIEHDIVNNIDAIDVVTHVEPCPHECDLTDETCKIVRNPEDYRVF